MAFTQEGLQAIRTEIDTDPRSRGYSGQSDEIIAELMNEPISLDPQEYNLVYVNPQKVVDKLIRMQEWDTVKDIAENGTGAPKKRAFYFVELMNLHQINVSMEDADLKDLVAGMTTDGTLTQDAKSALRDMSREEILRSRRESIGLAQPVTPEDIAAAKALP